MMWRKLTFILFLLVIADRVLKVNAERLVVHVQSVYNVQLTENVIDRFYVQGLIECASICDVNNCRLMKYDESSHVCVLYREIEEDYTTNPNDVGDVFITKESKYCVYTGYEYILELDVCLKFYHEKADRMTWEDSQQRCENEAGNLIIVSNHLKAKLIVPYLQVKIGITSNAWWWIGANDKDIEGIFHWVSGTNMTFTNWNSGQPDDQTSSTGLESADCVLYYLLKWFDRTCSSKIGSICENNVIS